MLYQLKQCNFDNCHRRKLVSGPPSPSEDLKYSDPKYITAFLSMALDKTLNPALSFEKWEDKCFLTS